MDVNHSFKFIAYFLLLTLHSVAQESPKEEFLFKPLPLAETMTAKKFDTKMLRQEEFVELLKKNEFPYFLLPGRIV